VKHALTLAVALSVTLLVSTAGAFNWVTWHCPAPNPNPPPPTCDSLGKAHYRCPRLHYYSVQAFVDADGDSLGPPAWPCPTCGLTTKYPADSVTCHNEVWGPHKYYAPSWTDYNYYIP